MPIKTGEPIQAKYPLNNLGEQWEVIDRGNGHHSIRNIGHKRYAASGSRSKADEQVKGEERDQTWLIQKTSEEGLQYTISTTDSNQFLGWGLVDNEQDTPITLTHGPTNHRNWWVFKDVKTGKDAEVVLDSHNGGAAYDTAAGDTILRAFFEVALPPVPPSKPFDLDLLVIQEMINFKFIRPATGTANRVSRNSLTPRAGEPPVVMLRLQVLSCTNLLAMDFWGTSDPYVIVSFLNQRHQTPIVERTLNPTYAAKDATFDFPIYLSLVDRLDVIQFLVWDKDVVWDDYLGEVAFPFVDWFNNGGLPFDHPKNMPFTLNIISKRHGTPSKGRIQIKLGFAPTNSNNRMEFEENYGEQVMRSWPSLLSAPPLFWLINLYEIFLNPSLTKVIKSASFSTPTTLSYKFETHYKSESLSTCLDSELLTLLVAISATGLYAELHAWQCGAKSDNEKVEGDPFKPVFDKHLEYLKTAKAKNRAIRKGSGLSVSHLTAN